MSSIRHGIDIERQASPVEYTFLIATKCVPDLRERAGQGCFVCLESHGQRQHAVLVPCLRPTEPRHARYTRKKTTIYKPNSVWDSAGESDCEIYERLLDTCYQHLGRWKRWLPYYGITEVQERYSKVSNRTFL